MGRRRLTTEHFEARLASFAQDLGHNLADAAVLGFATVCSYCDGLNEMFDDVPSDCARDTAQIVAFATGVERRYIRNALASSSLLVALAHSVRQAFEVPDADRDGDVLDNSKRLRRYTFLLRLLGGSGGRIIVFDEIEELLGSQDQLGWVAAGRTPMAGQKSWKNCLLETAAVPTTWIANSLAAIDPTLLRRFALVLQVQPPPRSRRVALLDKSAGALALELRVKRVLEDEAALTAADIERAGRAMELARPEGDTSTFLRALSLRAASPLKSECKHRFATLAYRIDWLNTTPPMADVMTRLALCKSGRLRFAGAPGTGKAALAQHLAKTLGLPLHVKKASDLLGMYLGETEATRRCLCGRPPRRRRAAARRGRQRSAQP